MLLPAESTTRPVYRNAPGHVIPKLSIISISNILSKPPEVVGSGAEPIELGHRGMNRSLCFPAALLHSYAPGESLFPGPRVFSDVFSDGPGGRRFVQ